MGTYRLTNIDSKTIDYVSAVNKTQASIAAHQLYPGQRVLVAEADKWEVDKLIRAHSLPMEGEK